MTTKQTLPIPVEGLVLTTKGFGKVYRVLCASAAHEYITPVDFKMLDSGSNFSFKALSQLVPLSAIHDVHGWDWGLDELAALHDAFEAIIAAVDSASARDSISVVKSVK